MIEHLHADVVHVHADVVHVHADVVHVHADACYVLTNINRTKAKAMRNPPWGRDELILALELYFEGV